MNNPTGPTGPTGPMGSINPSMSPDAERNWAVAAHLSSFAAAYVALGFLGPLVCMLLIRERSPFARRHALGIAYLVLVIMGAVAASRGEEFRYPLTIRMVS